jgi:hypothetical protein
MRRGIKVEIPEDSVPQFLCGLPFSSDEARAPREATFGSNTDFFDPSISSLDRYYEGRVAKRSLRLGVARSVSGRFIVYVVSFTT